MIKFNKLDIMVIFIFILIISILLGTYTTNKLVSNDNYIYKLFYDGNMNDNINKNEKFTVADANDFTTYNEQRIKSENAENEYADDSINNANEDDVINYNKNNDYVIQTKTHNTKVSTVIPQKKQYISSVDFGIEFPDQAVACGNTSINNKFVNKGITSLPFQIDCSKPNKFQASDYYRAKYTKQPIPLEDRLVRGYNYDIYSNYVSPYNIDIRLMTVTTKGSDGKLKPFPNPSNFAFHNTPAMRLL